MYLFFDTETTGVPKNWKAPVTDVQNWPRMVQLAWIVFDDTGKEIKRADHIIKPEGFTIPDEAARIHGITTDRALLEGEDLDFVLNEFRADLLNTTTIVAHNISFDEKIAGAEFIRSGLPNSLTGKKTICTMTGTVNFCAIEGPYGFKWPKLTELHQKLFGKGFDEAHNASADIDATAKCFWELKKRGLL